MKRAAVAVATILISTAALGAFHFAAGDRGWFMFQEGRTQEAAEAWREALAEAEKSGDRASVADAWSNIARASARAGDLAGAIHAAEEAVRATDVHDLAWFDRSARLAGLYHQAGRSDDAEDVWRDLISRYTGQSDADRDRRGQALFELGRLYHEVKRYADAEQAYLRSIATLEPLQARPFSEFALEGLALLYESLERFEDAHEACGRRLEASRALERPRDQQDAIAADCLRLGIERINPVEGRLPQHRVEGMCSSVLPKSQGEGAFYTTVFDGVPVTTFIPSVGRCNDGGRADWYARWIGCLGTAGAAAEVGPAALAVARAGVQRAGQTILTRSQELGTLARSGAKESIKNPGGFAAGFQRGIYEG